jgi:DNA polymerase III epsilon subunit-like protein
MSDRSYVFLDTETTGLHRTRRPWEVALIRRTLSNGLVAEQTRLHVCVDIADLDLASADPVGLNISGFHRRHPQIRERRAHFPRVLRADAVAAVVDEWTTDATIVGVRPRFDTECLAALFGRHRRTPHWQDDPVDVVELAVAAIRNLGLDPERDHDTLSRQCGVKPPSGSARHTALGDARWAMRWFDSLAKR